ncbi:MAG: VanZ family protein [Clostridia bacterium]|nr:VanZ family protein [Clostridia bacterium]
METTSKIRHLCSVAFILYIFVLFWVISLKCNIPASVVEAKKYFRGFTFRERLDMQIFHFAKTNSKDALLNIFVFIPFGMLTPFLAERNAGVKVVFFGFLLSVGFEFLQIISCIGMFTYVDIIHNMIGGIIGGFIYLVFHRVAKERPLKIAFVVSIISMMCILAFATVRTIQNIDIYF